MEGQKSDDKTTRISQYKILRRERSSVDYIRQKNRKFVSNSYTILAPIIFLCIITLVFCESGLIIEFSVVGKIQYCIEFFEDYHNVPEIYESYWGVVLPVLTIILGFNFMKTSQSVPKIRAMGVLVFLTLGSFVAVVIVNVVILLQHFPPNNNCQNGRDSCFNSSVFVPCPDVLAETEPCLLQRSCTTCFERCLNDKEPVMTKTLVGIACGSTGSVLAFCMLMVLFIRGPKMFK